MTRARSPAKAWADRGGSGGAGAADGLAAASDGGDADVDDDAPLGAHAARRKTIATRPHRILGPTYHRPNAMVHRSGQARSAAQAPRTAATRRAAVRRRVRRARR